MLGVAGPAAPPAEADCFYGGPVRSQEPPPPAATKQDWRREVAARRRARPAAERADVAERLCAAVLALDEAATARTVAAYASYSSEPGTGPLRAALRSRGIRVLLPVLLPDNDLDWVEDRADTSAGDLCAVSTALPAALLGPEAVSTADLVVCPATAATPDGDRLGKGGGSYDRVLARLDPRSLVVALVHDDEVAAALPTQSHDRPVDVVVTPTRTLRV
jgi:5-formyltetrahydrofolate cyclo-ligase